MSPGQPGFLSRLRPSRSDAAAGTTALEHRYTLRRAGELAAGRDDGRADRPRHPHLPVTSTPPIREPSERRPASIRSAPGGPVEEQLETRMQGRVN